MALTLVPAALQKANIRRRLEITSLLPTYSVLHSLLLETSQHIILSFIRCDMRVIVVK